MEFYNPLRAELYSIWREKLGHSHEVKSRHVRDYVLGKYEALEKKSVIEEENLKKHVGRFCAELQKRWVNSRKRKGDFTKIHHTWLSSAAFPKLSVERSVTIARGRPKKSFSKLNIQSKRHRVERIRELGPSNEIAFAAQLNARSEGNEDAAKLMHEVMQTTPTRPSKIRKSWKLHSNIIPPKKMTEDEGLAFFLDGDFTKDQWYMLRKTCKTFNSPSIFPSYLKLSEARNRSVPKDGIEITETRAEVKVQNLLDHTTNRIMCLVDSSMESLSEFESKDLELISKWGFDGSSDHSNYKQKFEDHDADDSAIFMTSLVPLQLRVRSAPDKVVWMNTKPSSTRMCRPIRLQFAKETTVLYQQEKMNVDEQIKKLRFTAAETSHGTQCHIYHTLVCTMCDGKVCSALTGISCQKCFVCEASPKQFNDLEAMKSRPLNQSTFEFGLSPLHAHIR